MDIKVLIERLDKNLLDLKILKSSLEARIRGTSYVESIRKIGAVSTGFIETETLVESFKSSIIKEVTSEDVTDKYFTDWFFKIRDMVDVDPEQFPFDMITHGGDIAVYGYFSDNKLDGIIRVDGYDDNYELSFFFVNTERQQQGVGQFLFQYVLNKYRDKKLALHVYIHNAPAIHIYKKYGFDIVETGYGMGYQPWLPHYVMPRNIPQ